MMKRIIILLSLSFLLMMSACGTKKCQQPATEKFKTIADQPWRLVETTNSAPEFKVLSNTTFLVFEFTKDYKGSVKKVENNSEYETPIQTFRFNIDPDQGLLRIQYQTAPADGQEEGAKAATSGGEIVDYDYELGRELEMTDDKGAYYRFVPYSGIIAPDEKCTF